MTATVRDLRDVTHVAICRPEWEDEPGEEPMIGALCEDTLDQFLEGTLTVWTTNEIGEDLADCMSCLVRNGQP